MEKKRIEGLWDCPSCGTIGIKGREDKCPNCGKVRDKDVYFYLPEDTWSATLTKAEAAKTTDEPDWLCAYCGCLNSSAISVCRQCDGPRTDSKKNYGTIHKLTGMFFRRGNREK